MQKLFIFLAGKHVWHYNKADKELTVCGNNEKKRVRVSWRLFIFYWNAERCLLVRWPNALKFRCGRSTVDFSGWSWGETLKDRFALIKDAIHARR